MDASTQSARVYPIHKYIVERSIYNEINRIKPPTCQVSGPLGNVLWSNSLHVVVYIQLCYLHQIRTSKRNLESKQRVRRLSLPTVWPRGIWYTSGITCGGGQLVCLLPATGGGAGQRSMIVQVLTAHHLSVGPRGSEQLRSSGPCHLNLW